MSLHKNIKILAWFNFFTDFRLFAPIAIIYFAQVSGSFTLAMSVFSIVFISAALFEIPTGVFADKIGTRNATIWGAVANVLALTCWAMGGSYPMLAVGAVFQGLGRSFYSGSGEALLHGTLAETNQEHEYHIFSGKLSSLFQLASAVASILGGVIAYYSFSLVMWLSVIPQMVCVVLAWMLVEPKVHTRETGNIYAHTWKAFKYILKNRKLRLLAIADSISFGVGEAGFEFQAAFYATLWPTWAIGIARTISNIAGTVSYYFAGSVINRFSAIKVLIGESIISPLVKMFATVVVTPLSPAIMAATSIMYGAESTAKNTLKQKEFTNEQRATMGSLISLMGSLCNAAAAFVLGVMADQIGVYKTIIFVQLTLLSLVVFYWKIYKHQGKI